MTIIYLLRLMNIVIQKRLFEQSSSIDVVLLDLLLGLPHVSPVNVVMVRSEVVTFSLDQSSSELGWGGLV